KSLRASHDWNHHYSLGILLTFPKFHCAGAGVKSQHLCARSAKPSGEGAARDLRLLPSLNRQSPILLLNLYRCFHQLPLPIRELSGARKANAYAFFRVASEASDWPKQLDYFPAISIDVSTRAR